MPQETVRGSGWHRLPRPDANGIGQSRLRSVAVRSFDSTVQLCALDVQSHHLAEVAAAFLERGCAQGQQATEVVVRGVGVPRIRSQIRRDRRAERRLRAVHVLPLVLQQDAECSTIIPPLSSAASKKPESRYIQ